MNRALLAFALLTPAVAFGHGAAPRVVEIIFPPQAPDLVWAITDQQGLFGHQAGERRWLCEDAAAPLAGFRGLAPVDDALKRWVVATNAGLFETDDAGCSFRRSETIEAPIGLWQDRAAPGSLIAATARADARDDVWRSDDGGRTWQAAGLALPGPVTSLRRAGDRILLTHAGGALQSDDRGATFAALATPPVEPASFRLLDLRFGVSDEIEETRLWRLEGDDWQPALSLDGPILSVLVGPDGRGLLSSTFSGVWTSEDDGRTWQRAEALDVPRLGCLTLAPTDGALWACTDIFQRGPWATARSTDFGRTWTPQMANFVDVAGGWLCAEDTPAYRECRPYCPETVTDGVCGEPVDEADAGPTDATPADAAADASPDAAPKDAAPPDAGTGPSPAGGGCQQTPGSGTAWPLLLIAALACRRKPARTYSPSSTSRAGGRRL